MTPKLSSLTPEDKIRIVAELDGNAELELWNDCLRVAAKFHETGVFEHAIGIFGKNYLASYDAIIPLIQKQKSEVWEKFCDTLAIVLELDARSTRFTSFHTLTATPPQLLNTLLVAAGKAEL